jgi:hypothetical protein
LTARVTIPQKTGCNAALLYRYAVSTKDKNALH